MGPQLPADLALGLIDITLVQQMRCWAHSGFHVDRSVKVAAGDRAALQRLAEYMVRCPLSLARLIRITPEGKVIYRADKEHCRQYPLPAEPDLFGGVARNFQVFEPLDFLAELTQHIPDKREHLIRYYGVYANKARKGCNSAAEDTAAAAAAEVVPTPPSAFPSSAAPSEKSHPLKHHGFARRTDFPFSLMRNVE